MSQADAVRWDEKWAARLADPPRPRRLLTAHRVLLPGGLALDVACGPGQNACWLAQQGYRVLAVDISRVALQAGRERARELGVSEQIQWLQADLDGWRPPADAFDLVCVFRFLARSLLPSLRAAVRPGGWLFYATRHVGLRRYEPKASLRYLLRRGELAGAFTGWAIIHTMEGSMDASLVAGRPAIG